MTKRASAIKQCSKSADARRTRTPIALIQLVPLDPGAAQMEGTSDLILCPPVQQGATKKKGRLTWTACCSAISSAQQKTLFVKKASSNHNHLIKCLSEASLVPIYIYCGN